MEGNVRAMVLEKVGRPLRLTELPDPPAPRGQMVVKVEACGVCRMTFMSATETSPSQSFLSFQAMRLLGP